MRKRYTLCFILCLLVVPVVTNAAFADSSVTIHNEVSTSSRNASSIQCHSVVHMNINGKEQAVTSDDCSHDVNVQEGNNSIHISNTTGTNTKTTPKATQQHTPLSTRGNASVHADDTKTFQQEQEMRKEFAKQQKDLDTKQHDLWISLTSWVGKVFSGKL